MQRGGAFGEAQDLGDGLDRVQAVDLVVREFQHGHPREGVHRAAVAREEGARGIAAEARLRACLAPREQEADRQVLNIPLEGPRMVSSKSLMSKASGRRAPRTRRGCGRARRRRSGCR